MAPIVVLVVLPWVGVPFGSKKATTKRHEKILDRPWKNGDDGRGLPVEIEVAVTVASTMKTSTKQNPINDLESVLPNFLHHHHLPLLFILRLRIVHRRHLRKPMEACRPWNDTNKGIFPSVKGENVIPWQPLTLVTIRSKILPLPLHKNLRSLATIPF